MSSMSSNDDLTPDFIKEEAINVIENLLFEKSKEKYLKTYENFINWRAEKKVKSLSESIFLAYFNELAKKLMPSTLWSIYSMLKTTMNTTHDLNLKKFTKLTSFLKRQSEGFKSKKSKVFKAQDVETFLNEAPDDKYLARKVAMILGISGACRSNELANIKVEDIENHGQLLLVKLPNTKTKTERTFVINEELGKLVRKYQALRPDNMQKNRFFLNYQNGKCLRQVIGKNKFAKMPNEIAAYLGLSCVELYTGHCFRRTSATTLLADSGANLTMLKRHGGWKSSKVAEGYIEDSVENKSKITNRITETINLRNQVTVPRYF